MDLGGGREREIECSLIWSTRRVGYIRGSDQGRGCIGAIKKDAVFRLPCLKEGS